MGGFTWLLTSGHHEISRGVRKLTRTPKILRKNLDKDSHFLLLHSKHVINTWMQKACSQMSFEFFNRFDFEYNYLLIF